MIWPTVICCRKSRPACVVQLPYYMGEDDLICLITCKNIYWETFIPCRRPNVRIQFIPFIDNSRNEKVLEIFKSSRIQMSVKISCCLAAVHYKCRKTDHLKKHYRVCTIFSTYHLWWRYFTHNSWYNFSPIL